MSAYGAIPPRHSAALPATCWTLRAKPQTQTQRPSGPDATLSTLSLTVHHITASTAPPALAALLYAQFDAELERGSTYPQENPITRAAFEAYFLAADVFVGVLEIPHRAPANGDDAQSQVGSLTIEEARGARQWEDCVGGAYYVKPNYPGRSSHICNAGFLVPPQHRGLGIATALARSYLQYAPRLGFKASVFNLVYVNNVASVRIWERLGFEKIGRVPRAGRLKRRQEDGGGEEYVDAWVIYKSFEAEEVV